MKRPVSRDQGTDPLSHPQSLGCRTGREASRPGPERRRANVVLGTNQALDDGTMPVGYSREDGAEIPLQGARQDSPRDRRRRLRVREGEARKADEYDDNFKKSRERIIQGRKLRLDFRWHDI